VYFVATKDDITLKDVATKIRVKRICADPGSDSSKRGIIGSAGEDKIILVPCGVAVYNENNILLGEYNYHECILYIFRVDFLYIFHVDFCFFFTTLFLFFCFFD